MNKVAKKCVVAIVLAFVLALAMEVAVQANNPPLYEYQFEGAVTEEYSPAALQLLNYETENTILVPTSEDPQMFLDFPSLEQAQKTSSLRIVLNEPLKDWEYIQLYFADQDGVYKQDQSMVFCVAKGVTEIIMELPDLVYPQIRIDINQPIALQSIQLSDQPATRTVLPEPWNFQRMLGIFAVLAVVIFLILFFEVPARIKKHFINFGRLAKQKPWKTLGVTAGIIVLFCLLLCLLLALLHKSPHPVYFVAVSLFGFVVAMFVLFYKSTGKRPELFFLVIMLCAAMLIVLFGPITQALVVWDDETHYAKMLNLSYIGEDTRMTSADAAFITRVYPTNFSLESQDKIYQTLDDMYHDGASFANPAEKISFEKLAYIPGALGLFLGRMFNLSFHNILIFARIMILLLFTVLCYFAIRKVKTGKMILIVLALLPTNVFLASNFSYDTWVTGFTILGLAWFFGECQEPKKLLSVRDWIIMLAAMAVGMSPKAIYFPLIALLFFMPKSKFASRRTHIIYLLSVAGTMFVVMATFLMPMVVQGAADMSDMRGGAGVSASGQIAYILGHPLDFAKMMAKYLPNYLSIGNAQNYVTSFAYYGDGYFYGVLIVLMGVVAFTDRNEFDRYTATVSHKIRTLLIALITVICVASALYIAFTPVGFDTVNGCQARYLMPVIFPVLYVIGVPFITNNMNRNAYNTTVFTISGLVLFFNIAYMVIVPYLGNN